MKGLLFYIALAVSEKDCVTNINYDSSSLVADIRSVVFEPCYFSQAVKNNQGCGYATNTDTSLDIKFQVQPRKSYDKIKVSAKAFPNSLGGVKGMGVPFVGLEKQYKYPCGNQFECPITNKQGVLNLRLVIVIEGVLAKMIPENEITTVTLSVDGRNIETGEHENIAVIENLNLQIISHKSKVVKSNEMMPKPEICLDKEFQQDDLSSQRVQFFEYDKKRHYIKFKVLEEENRRSIGNPTLKVGLNNGEEFIHMNASYPSICDDRKPGNKRPKTCAFQDLGGGQQKERIYWLKLPSKMFRDLENESFESIQLDFESENRRAFASVRLPRSTVFEYAKKSKVGSFWTYDLAHYQKIINEAIKNQGKWQHQF